MQQTTFSTNSDINRWKVYRLKHFPYIKKVCIVCKENYKGKGNRQTRCLKCQKIKCVKCSKLFTPKNKNYKQKFCSLRCRISILSIGGWNKGKECPQISGKNHWNWQGGKTAERIKIRMSLKYKLWRKAIFQRDNYSCKKCGARNIKLNADHIKSFAYFPELRFELSNGRTLCVPCHKETDNYMGRAKRLAQQILI